MEFGRKCKSQLLVLEARRMKNTNMVIYTNFSDTSISSADELAEETDTQDVPSNQNWWEMPENQDVYRKLLKYHKLVLYSLTKQYQYETEKQDLNSDSLSHISIHEEVATARTTNILVEGGKRPQKKPPKFLLPVEFISRSFGSIKKWRPSMKKKSNKQD